MQSEIQMVDILIIEAPVRLLLHSFEVIHQVLARKSGKTQVRTGRGF